MVEVEIESVRASYEIRGDEVVLMCPPHPLMGGNRFDVRLEKIASELIRNDISIFRFDYREPFRGGIGEVEDAKICLSYLKDRHSSIIVLGYSFGSLIASNVSPFCDAAVYISPIPEMNSIRFRDSSVPKLLIIALRDQFVSPESSMRLFDSLSDPKKLIKIDTDHFYFGSFDRLIGAVRDFVLDVG